MSGTHVHVYIFFWSLINYIMGVPPNLGSISLSLGYYHFFSKMIHEKSRAKLNSCKSSGNRATEIICVGLMYMIFTCQSLVSVSAQASAVCPPPVQGLPQRWAAPPVPSRLEADPPYSSVSPSPPETLLGPSSSGGQPLLMPYELPV